MNLVDLIAWMPYWIVLAVEGGFDSAGGGTNFGFIRAVRLMRVFRVFKFARYSVGIQMFLGAVAKSKQPLGVLLFMVCISTTIISSIMFMVEDDVSDERLSNAGVSREEHDTCYATIVRACWWCIVTMTTVGYGDCYPLSVAGKLMAMVTMLLGVFILALPITVVGSNFHKMVEMYEEVWPRPHAPPMHRPPYKATQHVAVMRQRIIHPPPAPLAAAPQPPHCHALRDALLAWRVLVIMVADRLASIAVRRTWTTMRRPTKTTAAAWTSTSCAHS